MSRPATSLEEALAACLDDLDRGVSLAECLACFPEHAAELVPSLQAATRVRAKPMPALSLGGRVYGRERMHAALAQRRAGYGWLRAWVGGLAGLVVLLVLAAGVWFSSPGRDSRLRGEPTAQPAAPSTGANATPSVAPTLEAQISQTPSPSPTSTNEGASVTATAAPTPSPTVSTTPTPSRLLLRRPRCELSQQTCVLSRPPPRLRPQLHNRWRHPPRVPGRRRKCPKRPSLPRHPRRRGRS